MGVYDVGEVLRTIDRHTEVVVLLLLCGWVGGFVQIVEALRLGFTQRVAGQPVATTVIMLAHDATFSLGYHHWFVEIGHPCFELFWVGMVVSNAIELVLLVQWVRFRDSFRSEPTSAPLYTAVVLVFGVFAFALWGWVRSLLDDPLDLVGLTLVQVGAVVFAVPMLLGRGSARGQSRIFAWATLLGPGSLGFLFIPYLAPRYAWNWPFAALVLATTACAVTYLVLYERLRRQDARRRRDVPARGPAVPA